MDQVVSVLGFFASEFSYTKKLFLSLRNKLKISGLHAVVIISQLSDLKCKSSLQ